MNSSKLKNFEKLDKDFILKFIFIIQIIYKTEESLGDFINSTIIKTFLEIFNNLLTHPDLTICKSILNILSAFALNDDLNVTIRQIWLRTLIEVLADYARTTQDIVDIDVREI